MNLVLEVRSDGGGGGGDDNDCGIDDSINCQLCVLNRAQKTI